MVKQKFDIDFGSNNKDDQEVMEKPEVKSFLEVSRSSSLSPSEHWLPENARLTEQLGPIIRTGLRRQAR